MTDEHVENQGRRAEEILASAQGRLQAFLDENYQLVRTMRAKAQLRSMALSALNQQERELSNFIGSYQEKLKEKKWSAWGGRLCRINDDKTEMDHSPNDPIEEKEIRGMQLEIGNNLEENGMWFYVVELDASLSRRHYDLKDEKGKEEFIRRAHYRHEPRVEHYARLMPNQFYGVLISDQGGKYKVEKVVPA